MKQIKGFHENCFACGEHVRNGLKLKFELLNNGILYGRFKMHKIYQGYDNILHGGITTTILDCSMINLFYMKDELELKTARLNIRYGRPIPVEEDITVEAFAEDNIRHFERCRITI